MLQHPLVIRVLTQHAPDPLQPLIFTARAEIVLQRLVLQFAVHY